MKKYHSYQVNKTKPPPATKTLEGHFEQAYNMLIWRQMVWPVTLSVSLHFWFYKRVYNSFFVRLKDNTSNKFKQYEANKDWFASRWALEQMQWQKILRNKNVVVLFLCTYIRYICIYNESKSWKYEKLFPLLR